MISNKILQNLIYKLFILTVFFLAIAFGQKLLKAEVHAAIICNSLSSHVIIVNESYPNDFVRTFAVPYAPVPNMKWVGAKIKMNDEYENWNYGVRATVTNTQNNTTGTTEAFTNQCGGRNSGAPACPGYSQCHDLCSPNGQNEHTLLLDYTNNFLSINSLTLAGWDSPYGTAHIDEVTWYYTTCNDLTVGADVKLTSIPPSICVLNNSVTAGKTTLGTSLYASAFNTAELRGATGYFKIESPANGISYTLNIVPNTIYLGTTPFYGGHKIGDGSYTYPGHANQYLPSNDENYFLKGWGGGNVNESSKTFSMNPTFELDFKKLPVTSLVSDSWKITLYYRTFYGTYTDTEVRTFPVTNYYYNKSISFTPDGNGNMKVDYSFSSSVLTNKVYVKCYDTTKESRIDGPFTNCGHLDAPTAPVTLMPNGVNCESTLSDCLYQLDQFPLNITRYTGIGAAACYFQYIPRPDPPGNFIAPYTYMTATLKDQLRTAINNFYSDTQADCSDNRFFAIGLWATISIPAGIAKASLVSTPITTKSATVTFTPVSGQSLNNLRFETEFQTQCGTFIVNGNASSPPPPPPPPPPVTPTWMQSLGGDSYVNGGITNMKIPNISDIKYPVEVKDTYKYCPTPTACASLDYFSSYISSKLNGAFTEVAGKNSKASRSLSAYNDQNQSRYYADVASWQLPSLFLQLTQNNTGNSPSTLANAAALATAGNGVFTSPALNIPANTTCSGKKLIFVNGNLTINPPFKNTDVNSGCLFIVSGNTSITATSGTGVSQIDGFIIARNALTSASVGGNNDAELYVNGSLISNTAQFSRSTSNNNERPAELIKYDPRYIDYFRAYLGTDYSFKVREINY